MFFDEIASEMSEVAKALMRKLKVKDKLLEEEKTSWGCVRDVPPATECSDKATLCQRLP